MLAKLRAYTDWPDPSLAARYTAFAHKAFTSSTRFVTSSFGSRKASRSRKKMPNPSDSTLSYLPTDRVYEYGFDPLKDGRVRRRGKRAFRDFRGGSKFFQRTR